MKIDKILQNINNINKEITEWNMDSLDEFIISFERNSVISNESIAKQYGNIIKNITRDIMTRDIPILEEWRVDEILTTIKDNVYLYSRFNKLYTLVKKKKSKR